MLASQSSFGDKRAGSRPVVHPATVAILNLQHKSLPGFFAGLRPNPRLSINDVLARQHPAPKCAASSARSSPLPWFERLLGVATVHAQPGNCTGQYWAPDYYFCAVNQPLGCDGEQLDTTDYDPGRGYYYGGQYCCVSCPGNNGCGMAYPYCYNGGS